MKDTLSNSLDDEPLDRTTALVRGAIGLVPVAGSILAELINSLIPNQRIDRIASYVRLLEGQISGLAADKLRDPINIDIFEDGAFQAIRATSETRIKLLARSVAEGFKAEDADKLSEKRILYIISQLDEGDFVMLEAYASHFESNRFSALRPPPPVMGCSDEVANQNALYAASIEKLERLSLIRFSIRMNSENGIPKFNKMTGKPDGHRSISRLGRLLLERAEICV